MNRFHDKTVVISGAGRGQGRAHALGFAAEGANVVAFDICDDVSSSPISLSSSEDLKETAALVRSAGGTIDIHRADVRDADAVAAVFSSAVRTYGKVDIVLANAGVIPKFSNTWEFDELDYEEVVDIDLLGVWRVLKAGVLTMLEGEVKGAIIVTGSGASIKGIASLSPYVAAKHGLVGMVRTAARELGRYGIRVNMVAPGNVNTDMIMNSAVYQVYFPDRDAPTQEEFCEMASSQNPMGQPYVEPDDVTRTVMYLASEDARFVTGSLLPVDGGQGIP